MKKLIGIKILAAALIMFLLAMNSPAQTRIRIAPGKKSATFVDIMSSRATDSYVINLEKGQKLTITVVSTERIQVYVYDVDGRVGNGDGYYKIRRTKNDGDHKIILKNWGDGSTRYTMTVSVR